ncbi:MAG: GAF domain-containing protein [Armatimonadetes bacterium]|nr:GAF domain-containing protein [Armatimonadota bacterium]
MVELAVRIALATALLLVSGTTGRPTFDLSWKSAAVFTTYSFFAFLLERRGMRNAGVSGLVGVADAAVVVFLLSATGHADTFGFLALLPTAYAVARFGADALAVSPLVVAWLLIGAGLFGGPGWTPSVLIQACGVLGLGMLGARREKTVRIVEYVETVAEGPASEPIPAEFFELREKYRTLRQHASEIERRSKRDHVTARLVGGNQAEGLSLASLANRLREIFGVEGLTLYALDDSLDLLVVRAASGDVPVAVSDSSFPVPEFVSEWQLRDRLTDAVKALKTPENAQQTATVVLKDCGRIVGLLALFDGVKTKVSDAAESARDASEAIARFLKGATARDRETKRLRQSELLYMIASTVHGAETATTLSHRIAREVWESLAVDHLSIEFFGHRGARSVQGSAFPLIASMSFDEGTGLEGWKSSGGPEIVIDDARQDDRAPRETALKHRIGSFFAVPVRHDGETVGIITTGTHRAQGVDADAIEAVRIVAAELGQAYGRAEGSSPGPGGLATPIEFHEAVKDADEGFFVYLDVLKRDESVEAFGRVAVDKAVRRLAHRLRSLLPSGGLLCRRPEGDFVAFLRTSNEEEVRHWAAQAGVAASMVTLDSLDGKTKIPMAVRAKVALFAPHSHRISREVRR